MGITLRIENADLGDDGYEVTSEVIVIIIALGICVIDRIYRYKQRSPKIEENTRIVSICENKIVNFSNTIRIQRIEICYEISLYLIPKTCIGSISIRSTAELDKPINQILPPVEDRRLICYCDGSYSHLMQIGYSGFRASNGVHKTRFLSPSEPRDGSTAAEVLAANLAIQYALEHHYNTLIIHTDNSKVEQLLRRPKMKDRIKHSDICQSLYQYQSRNGHDTIQVIRVRGHPSIGEQRTCPTKHEFAKIDRTVRNKTRRYKRKYWIPFEQNYYHGDKSVYYLYGTCRVFKYHVQNSRPQVHVKFAMW